ncbi:MAG: DUF4214 domain-containing protein [Gammaproteobacteria bacterium]|uniref:M14 family zinc carboxypeptidase n=1 Tax=Vreelandella venusta TaxID=44935 RepID=UPI003AA823FB|nr:DUF4214 domain-containing protein [Gammaproteobacteria bacterium]
MELQDSGKIVQSIYFSLLGRAADPEGFGFWQERLESDGLQAVLSEIASSKEAQTYMQEASDSEYVADLYEQLFARAADTEGHDFWAGKLEAGELSRAELRGAVIQAAADTDTEALNAKLAVADYYSQNVSAENYSAEQSLVMESLHSNEQLYAELQRLDTEYQSMDLSQVGESVEGNPLYKAVVGSGPKTLMIATQQHGDEPLGTEAALYLLEYLAGDSVEAKALREEVTVVVMPRVNPDGFARWEQQVAGAEDVLDPRRNSNDIDLNRTYDPNEEQNPEQAPESAAVREVVKEYRPDLYLDYHHQNNYRSEDETLDSMSVLWATSDEVEPALMESGQRAVVAIKEALEDFEHDSLTLFPGSDNPAISRNGFALDGTPTLLIEQRGLQEMDQLAQGLDLDYSALAAALTLEGWLSMIGVIEFMASGEFDSLDPAIAQQIAERSEYVDFADLYSDDAVVANIAEEAGDFEEAFLAGVSQGLEDGLVG